eukprot:CAMPEP_0113900364 /NCGR_PEP_ID=MMETSP0780_2-20120614/20628_1 /TAXON_ID=652834 /ORGANISM="Palpitomonas bilix" /LENGTH=674 /DNA_ID=CAMNT_0000892799 /DNA_START=313 /DNA_END=2337 /DNA_ORIENTATION=- /assembly_acc=CAM_ASM_000599
MAKLILKEEEYAAIIDKYLVSREDKHEFNYFAFCASIDGSFDTKSLTGALPDASAYLGGSGRQRTLPILSDTKEEKLAAILAAFREQVVTRRVFVKPYFQDYDQVISCHTVGHVTKAQFRQGLTMLFPYVKLQNSDYEILEEKYADASNHVDYVAFAADVDPDPAANASNVPSFSGPLHITESIARSRANQTLTSTAASNSGSASIPKGVQDILDNIKAKMYRDRVRSQEFFRDFDKLRAGVVSVSQFRIALSMSGVRLNETDFATLAGHYANHENPSMINWMKYVDDIESVFVQKGLERTPTAQPPSRPDDLLSTTTRSLAERDEVRAMELIARLREDVSVRRVLVKPYFEDYDRNIYCHNLNHVTEGQFRQALDFLFPNFHFAPRDYEILSKRYDDQGNGDANYRLFTQDVDPDPGATFSCVPTFNGPLYTDRTKTGTLSFVDHATISADAAPIIQKLQQKVFQDRVRVIDFFRDYDKLRKGTVQKNKFRSGLDMCKLSNLTESEHVVLEREFGVPGNSGLVDYVKFAAVMDDVFKKRDTSDMTLTNFRAATQKTITEDDYSKLDNILDVLRGEVKTRRVLVKPVFEDFDRVNSHQTCGYTTRAQFRQALAILFPAVTFSEKDYELMCERYRLDSKGSIDYLAFTADVDPDPASLSSTVPSYNGPLHRYEGK